MGKHFLVLAILPLIALVGCAGLNPNPGERTADLHMFSAGSKDCERSLEIVRPNAEAGLPWAELRLGYAYLTGCGVAKNGGKAAEWLNRVATKSAEGGWATGQIVGAIGQSGFFNQNSDALIAQFYLSVLYNEGDGVPKNLIDAYLYAKNVAVKSDGKAIFFCCEWAKNGGLYLSQKAIQENLSKIEAAMNAEQKKDAEERLQTRKP